MYRKRKEENKNEKIPLRKLREGDRIYLGYIEDNELSVEILEVLEITEDEDYIRLSCCDNTVYELAVRPLSKTSYFEDCESIITTSEPDLATWFEKEVNREIKRLEKLKEEANRRYGKN